MSSTRLDPPIAPASHCAIVQIDAVESVASQVPTLFGIIESFVGANRSQLFLCGLILRSFPAFHVASRRGYSTTIAQPMR